MCPTLSYTCLHTHTHMHALKSQVPSHTHSHISYTDTPSHVALHTTKLHTHAHVHTVTHLLMPKHTLPRYTLTHTHAGRAVLTSTAPHPTQIPLNCSELYPTDVSRAGTLHRTNTSLLHSHPGPQQDPLPPLGFSKRNRNFSEHMPLPLLPPRLHLPG